MVSVDKHTFDDRAEYYRGSLLSEILRWPYDPLTKTKITSSAHAPSCHLLTTEMGVDIT